MGVLTSGWSKLDDGKQLLFIISSEPSGQFSATAVSSDNRAWRSFYTEEEWTKMYEEGEAFSNEEFVKWLGDETSKVSAEQLDEKLKIKWTKDCEDGFDFEFCSLTLDPKEGSLLEVFDVLLKDREELESRAVAAEEEIGSFHSKMDKIEALNEETRTLYDELRSSLIARFVAILNQKLEEKRNKSA